MKQKSKLSKFNVFLAVVLVIVLVANVVVISTKAVPVAADAADASSSEDAPVIDAFVAGTYGGKTFDTMEDVVNYYVECYNYTKTLTTDLAYGGERRPSYKLVGDENLSVENLLIEGKSNDMINKLVPGILSQVFHGGVIGLAPSGSSQLEWDSRDDGKFDCSTSSLTPDDVLACNVVDNNDGTITITIQPKAVVLSQPGADAQGRFFNSLGDISSTVESISVLSFSEGTIDENFVVDYKGGTGKVTIDTATGEITTADYEMDVHIDVKHACVTVIKNKSASLDIIYTNHYPASDEYLSECDMSR